MKRIVEILLWIWQAPQNIIGLVMRLWYRTGVEHIFIIGGTHYWVVPDLPGNGISLASTVFVRTYHVVTPERYVHEFGHVIQSRILGPLYLFVIGIPSLLWACWYKKHRRGSYYNFYTEKWADSLGGVKRTNL